MANFRREIVGRCYRVETFHHGGRKIKTNRYSIESREDVTTRTSFGWRLSCGHVLDGQQGHGKKSKQCYYCEWIAEGREEVYLTPESIDRTMTGWKDIPDETAYEAIRSQAQS